MANIRTNVTDNNVAQILGEGKKEVSKGAELSVISLFNRKEDELSRTKRSGANLKKSELGNPSEIRLMQSKLAEGVKELEALQKKLAAIKNDWEKEAYPIFISACNANTRILLGSDKINITPSKKDDNNAPGVYTTSDSVAGTVNTKHLPDEVAEDIKNKAKSLSEIWKQYLSANAAVWQKVKEMTGNLTDLQTTVSETVQVAKSFLEKEYASANEYYEWSRKVKKLDFEIENLRQKKDQAMAFILEIDPILTAFSLPSSDKTYDPQWLKSVKAVADVRQSLPYLPLIWQGSPFGSVFNWKEAIENGKPNLFIEAATDEGLEGRMDMLDNFLATILLAFPPKQVHVTVLENRTVNSFVTNLPDKICQIYDASADTESIRLFTRHLKEMYRAGRENPAPDCCPREIVVIAGFERRDRNFTRLMDDLHDIIENGRRAGIYFAMVLSKDITEYEWNDADANDFEQYFTPYSTILTEKKDKQGNPIPDYNLLRRDADVPTDEGDKPGSLAELVTAYLEKGASTVPNKVYEKIENGELYNGKPIMTLDEQPRKDAGKLVIPIAQTDGGDELCMRLDDESYISCFILGRSGMGKSFTLHTILTNLMLKYDPSVVEVLLMDFKPGGVEMNYYKDTPHVSSLLVNGADRQVAGEILTSIMKEMDRRGELFQKYDVSSIGRYNSHAAKNGLEQMKHIVLLVDECQDLFKVENPNSDTNIVTDIARKGRSYGIHMILATQTLQKTDIPGDALAQFSDFLFMGCKEDDVMKCEINNRDVQKQVGQLVKGEVIYCHRGSEPVHGYVYNYYGKKGEYRDKTRESLLSRRFSRPAKKQFYFNASQTYLIDKEEMRLLSETANSGLKAVPMAVLGKNLSVKADTLYSKFGTMDGANLLVLGANELLQGERVLWNAMLSLYECNKSLRKDARFYILPNIPEDVDADARNAHLSRMSMLKDFANRPGVMLADEAERLEIIERVAATVRARQQLAETDRSAVKGFDSIYLVIPNQQLLYTKMARTPRGLASLDGDMPSTAPAFESPAQSQPAQNMEVDSLGFEGLVMPGQGQDSATSAPDFMSIDFGSFGATEPSSPTPGAAKPGRNMDEELRYILEYGPSVDVHVLLQSSAPDKIYAEDAMREKEMTLLFNDIAFLRMLQASSMSLPVDSRVIERLSADPKSLRAVAYNGSRGDRTVVPFDFPVLNNQQKNR